MKCGIFDSGVGGLSVASAILKAKLFDEIINKNESTIIRYSLEAMEFLKNFDIDFLIVACNTASAVAIDELKKEATFPVVGVIEAGIEAIENEDREANILLIGTKRTIESKKYETLLKKKGFKNITSIATPLFVPLVEEGIFEGKIIDDVFEFYFKNINRSKIPFLSASLRKYFFNAKLIHSGQAIVRFLRKKYKLFPKKSTDIKLFSSENPTMLRKVAKKKLNLY